MLTGLLILSMLLTLGLPALAATPNRVQKSDLQRLEDEYRKLRADGEHGKLTLEAMNRYVVNSKAVLDKLGIKSEIVLRDSKKILRILPIQEKNKLNRLAFSLNKNFRGLRVEIDPHETLKEGALGFYYSETNTLVLAQINEAALSLADSTFAHEIRHASMTFHFILNEIDNVFNYELAKKEDFITIEDREKNGYIEYLSMQELSTFPIEAKQILALMKRELTDEEREKFLSDIEDVLSQTQKQSEYVYSVMLIFTDALAKNQLKSSIGQDHFLDKAYETLTLETKEYTFTMPFFKIMQSQNRGQLLINSLETTKNFSYELWLASTEAVEAFQKWTLDKSVSNWPQVLATIDRVSAVTRSRLAK